MARILIVDDDPFILKLLQSLLVKTKPHEMTTALGGEKALFLSDHQRGVIGINEPVEHDREFFRISPGRFPGPGCQHCQCHQQQQNSA